MDDWHAPPQPARRRRPAAVAALLALAVAGGLFVRGGGLDGSAGVPGALDVDAGATDGRQPVEGAPAPGGGSAPDDQSAPDGGDLWEDAGPDTPEPAEVLDGKAQGLVDGADGPDAGDGTEAGVWEPMPDAPLAGRAGHGLVWSGEELLVWGGWVHEPPARGEFFADGAAYDPGSVGWRTLAPAPLEPRSGHGSVWTGEELVVWGGAGATSHFADGAAYDPDADAWRPIAPAPLSPRQRPAAVWTGDELLVLGGFDHAGPLRDAAAYAPDRDAWRPLPDLPHAFAGAWNLEGTWAGDAAVVWAQHVDDPAPGARFDPASEDWELLPPVARRGPVAAAWAGDQMLALRGSALVAWRPGGDGWEQREAPWGSSEPWFSRAHWTGTDLLVVRGADRPRVDVYDPAADRWAKGPTLPSGVGYGPSVWTGAALLLWGGTEYGPLGPSATGAAFRPGGDG